MNALALNVLLALPLAAQQVHVVDSAGGGDFTSLVTAIDTAASGDTLLVKPGNYIEVLLSPSIEAKSLTIIGDGSPAPIVDSLRVSGLQAGQSVRLRGLTIGPPSYVAPGIRVSDCAGLLWIEDCTLVGHDGFKLVGPITFPGLPGLVVADSDAVVVVRSVTVGGNGPNPPIDGGFGVRVLTSHVALYECVVSGGDGGTGQGGGDALSAENADLVFVDCSVVGGLGGDGCTSVVPGPCRGGDGLVLEGGVTLFHLDTTIAGGLGGTLIGGGSALPGDPQVVTPDDAVEAWPGTGRSLTVDSPVREGELATLRFEGEPGDTVGVFAALTPGYALMPGNLGVFTLGPPLTGPILLRTVTSPDGTLEVPFRAWPLGAAGLEAGDVFGQGFVLTAGGSVQVSGPTMLTVLDGSL